MQNACACLLAFALLCTAAPCAAADLEAVCKQFQSCYNDGGHDVCWKRLEHQFLRKRDAKASREGRALHVMTLRGPVIFTDGMVNELDAQGAWHRYLGYFPDIQQHLVGVVYYEGNNYVLVSHTTANAVFTGNDPHVSPSLGSIVSAAASEANQPNEIRLWTVENGRLRLEHSEPMETISATFVRWEDDASFTLDEFDSSRKADCPKGKYPKLQYTYRWERAKLSRSVAKEPNFRCQDNW